MQQKLKKIVNFFYELGMLKRTIRAHSTLLLAHDPTDNIASHSYRVSMIGWYLATLEKVDTNRVVKMCLLHDIAEARSGDQQYVNKKYMKVFEEEVFDAQFSDLPQSSEFIDLLKEYNERKSVEAIVAKEADLLDQVLLLKEYAWTGNKEAEIWLHGKGGKKVNAQIAKLKTKWGKKLGQEILEQSPSEWWNTIWTSERR